MNVFLVMMLVLVALSFGAWVYSSYARSLAGPGIDPAEPAPWAHSLALLGVLLIAALMLVLLSGWRPGLW